MGVVQRWQGAGPEMLLLTFGLVKEKVKGGNMRLWFSLIMKSQANNDTMEWRCHEVIKLKKLF